MTNSRSQAPVAPTPASATLEASPQPAAPPTPVAPPADVRNGGWWAAGLYALVTLVLMWPALQGQFLVNPASDLLSAYAYRVFEAEMLRATGSIPQWNPYILGGIPYVAGSGFGDVFYPAVLMRLFMPVDVAVSWALALHIFLAGFFTYRFLRAWGFGYFPSLIGGVAYMLSGQVASLVTPGHDGKLYVSALTPLLLWMMVRALRDGRLWAYGMIAITTGLMIVSPHYQLMYYTGVMAGAFALYLAFRKGEDALERPVALRRLAGAAAAALLGVAIGAIQFVPFFEYIQYSPRAGGGRGWEYAISYSMPPEEMINVYLPQFSGIVEYYWGRNPLKYHGEYLGASVLVLAGAAFGSSRRKGFVFFWSAIAVWALLVAFGGHTPFYYLWYRMPMMSVVRAPGMIFFIVSLVAAVLAAVGAERLLTEPLRRSYLLGWVAFAVLSAVLAWVGFFSTIANLFVEGGKAPLISLNESAVQFGALRSALFVILTVALIWLLAHGRLKPVVAASALAVVAAADLWSIDRHYFRFSPNARQLYAADEAINYLRQLPEPARVISFSVPNEASVGRSPFTEGDGLTIYRIRATTGHHGNELQRWVDLAGAKSPAINTERLLSPEFRRLTNTRFLLTDIELPPNTGLIKRVGPVKGSVGSNVYLYEFPDAAPPAWVAPVIVEAPPEPIFRTVLDPRFDPRQAALFDSTPDIQGIQVSVLPDPSPVVARITAYEPAHISVELDRPATAGSALVVSENYYPGWSAMVDGTAAPVGRADYTFVGVALREGARRIELTFRDPLYPRGKAITLLALAASLALVVAGVWGDVRRRRG
ncbi:MAG TPA: YfhO family protein [Gemmatimonadaceae bacterium]|nr:YfhO family protein [Gemmatimonadaceae bacterium]